MNINVINSGVYPVFGHSWALIVTVCIFIKSIQDLPPAVAAGRTR